MVVKRNMLGPWQLAIIFAVMTGLTCGLSVLGANSQTNYRVESSYGEHELDGAKLIVAKAHYPFQSEPSWKVLTEIDKFPRFMPRFKVVEFLGESKKGKSYYVKVDLPSPFSDIWNIIVVNVNETERRVDWRMIEGNLKQNTGHVTLKSSGNVQILDFQVALKMGGLVPNSVVGWAATKYLPKLMVRIGNRIKFQSMMDKNKNNKNKNRRGFFLPKPKKKKKNSK